MKRKVTVRALVIVLLAFGSFSSIIAQEVNQAIEAFNKALELQSSDPKNAIVSLNSCLELCEQIGEDADDVKMRAELKLP